MTFEQSTNDGLIGQLMQGPINTADLDLKRIAAELENIARWLKNRSVYVATGNPGDFLGGFGSAPSDDPGINILRSIASGA
jgi:hypothetical protein